jgi:hypothetical protein
LARPLSKQRAAFPEFRLRLSGLTEIGGMTRRFAKPLARFEKSQSSRLFTGCNRKYYVKLCFYLMGELHMHVETRNKKTRPRRTVTRITSDSEPHRLVIIAGGSTPSSPRTWSRSPLSLRDFFARAPVRAPVTSRTADTPRIRALVFNLWVCANLLCGAPAVLAAASVSGVQRLIAKSEFIAALILANCRTIVTLTGG